MTTSSKYSIFLLGLMAMVLVACGGCKGTILVPPDPPEEEEPQERVDPDPKYVKEPEDLIWYETPCFNVRVANAEAEEARLPIMVRITTDTKQLVQEITDTLTVGGGKETNYVVTPTVDMAPGFYRAICFVKGKTVRNFNFGVKPFDIVSAPDMQADYTAYWQGVKDQLAAVDMNAVLTEIESKSSATRKVYLVEMYSVPDGLSGEPVKIRGYYCEPTDGEKHPVLIHYYGYDTQGTKAKCECPSGGSSKYAEFYLSHRGQYLNNRPASTQNPGITEDCVNIYGDWFAYQFGNKDSYYYRGAFMDAVQAVRFMATRETSDMTKLFAEGSSQGGALCYAAAGLSDMPFTAITANVAFLGDFPDYFKIVDWPGSTAKAEAKKAGMSDEEMYAFLSYYDTKNLATRIPCAVQATSGLKDGTCPPHTNIAPYNIINNPQSEYHFYPEMTHDYPKNWFSMIEEFRKKFL